MRELIRCYHLFFRDFSHLLETRASKQLEQDLCPFLCDFYQSDRKKSHLCGVHMNSGDDIKHSSSGQSWLTPPPHLDHRASAVGCCMIGMRNTGFDC